jgi:hypothetical protein
VVGVAYDDLRAACGNDADLTTTSHFVRKAFVMKRITSAFLLAAILVTGGAGAANAAPAKSGAVAPVSSLDRVGGWPY